MKFDRECELAGAVSAVVRSAIPRRTVCLLMPSQCAAYDLQARTAYAKPPIAYARYPVMRNSQQCAIERTKYMNRFNDQMLILKPSISGSRRRKIATRNGWACVRLLITSGQMPNVSGRHLICLKAP